MLPNPMSSYRKRGKYQLLTFFLTHNTILPNPSGYLDQNRARSILLYVDNSGKPKMSIMLSFLQIQN